MNTCSIVIKNISPMGSGNALISACSTDPDYMLVADVAKREINVRPAVKKIAPPGLELTLIDQRCM